MGLTSLSSLSPSSPLASLAEGALLNSSCPLKGRQSGPLCPLPPTFHSIVPLHPKLPHGQLGTLRRRSQRARPGSHRRTYGSRPARSLAVLRQTSNVSNGQPTPSGRWRRGTDSTEIATVRLFGWVDSESMLGPYGSMERARTQSVRTRPSLHSQSCFLTALALHFGL